MQTLDEIFNLMLTIPKTGGHLYKHSHEQVAKAKQAIAQAVMEAVGEDIEPVQAPGAKLTYEQRLHNKRNAEIRTNLMKFIDGGSDEYNSLRKL